MRDRLDRYQSFRIDVCNTRAHFAGAVVPIFAEVVSIFAELVLVLQHLCRVFAIVGRERSVSSSILVFRLVKSNGQVMCQCWWVKNVFIKSRIGTVGSGRPNALSGFEGQNCKRRYLRKEQVENIIFESHPYPRHPT